MGRVGDWLARKVREPLVRELRQGADPDGLATSVATGAALGILPFLGLTTLACLAAGRLLRLNHVALQVANYLALPLQLALLVPFVRLGERLTGSEALPIDPSVIVARFWESPLGFLGEFGVAGLHGLLGWTLVAIPAGWVVRRTLLPVFSRLSQKP
jgi:uncharacterized protein (DUF2062 family)